MNKKIKYFIYAIALILTVILSVSNATAKYKSEKIGEDNARVAKFGELNLYEYKTNNEIVNMGSSAEIETININPGTTINKNLSVSYSGNEIDVYIYLVIESNGWLIEEKENTNETNIFIKNNGDKILEWTLNNNWKYLEEASSTNKHVFYYENKANNTFNNTIMSSIEVNSMSLSNANILEDSDYSIKFNTYAVSALNVTPLEAWQFIK